MKKAPLMVLVMVALFVDGVQAAMSAGVFVLSAFPGTFAGAAAGCAMGSAVGGSLGCDIGGFLLGIVGSIPLINGVLATVTLPVGVILGFVISACLSMTIGAGLITLLMFSGMFYPKFLLPGGVAELIPGFNLIPTWTAITILSVLQKNKEKGGVVGTVASVATGNKVTAVASVAGARPRTPPPGRAMDGIQPAANDNNLPGAQRYAA